jgi:large subunit ribosomal protein L21
MYAVIETGGKQYRVEVGMELEVELLEAGPGDAVTLDRVLLVADGETAAIGRPLVDNASVAAEVLRRERAEKVISFKYRPKARRRVKKGHRQEKTVLRISDIVLDGRSAAADAAKAAEARLTERQRLEEAARRQAEADATLAAKLKPATPKAGKGAKAEVRAAAEGPAKAGRRTRPAKPELPAEAAPAEAEAPEKAAKPSSKAAAGGTPTKSSTKQSAKGAAAKPSSAAARASRAKTTEPATPRTPKGSAEAAKASATEAPADKPERAREPKKDE